MNLPESSLSTLSTPLDPYSSRHLEFQEERPVWFRLSFSERKITLAVIDLAFLNAMLLLSQFCRHDTFAGQWNLSYFITLTLVWLGVGLTLDAYNLRRAAVAFRSTVHSAGCVLLTCLICVLVPIVSPDLPGKRTDLLFFPTMSVLSVALWRMSYAMFLAHFDFTRRLLVIGAGRAGRTLAEAIGDLNSIEKDGGNGQGYDVLGFIDDDPKKLFQRVGGVLVVGNRSQLAAFVDRLKPDAIVLAISDAHTMHAELFASILACRERGFQIVSMQKIYEEFTGRVPVEHAGYDLDVVVPNSVPLFFDLYMGIRRGADIAAGLVGCAVTAMLIPMVWLANQLFAPGDLFYRQERLGKASRPFRVAKFRSMCIDAEESSGAVWAVKDDKRITPVGKVLRRTRLDEFPQFWNVLKGEMSLIGPRPERPEFVKQLSESIPFYRIRHAVKPGITGWAQVRFRYGASEEDSLTKLQFDLYYIKHQGPLLDIQIVLRTIMVMLGLKGQ